MMSITALLNMFGDMLGLPNNSPVRGILAELPTTLESAMGKFSFDAEVKIYAACPACHSLHEGIPTATQGSLLFPSICANDRIPGIDDWEPCESRLLDPAGLPLRPFFYHSFPDFLAEFLSRADIERDVDKACDDLCASLDRTGTFQGSEELDDVFQGNFVRRILDCDGRSLFVRRRDNEARLLFSLNVDWFNPEGNRLRGSSKSLGIVALCCLNLPVEKRYKLENMYLAAIIPGPREPKGDGTFHYLKPLFLHLRQALLCGFQMSRTAAHRSGRLAKATLVFGVLDLKAARKVAGLKSETSLIFCSRCELWKDAVLSVNPRKVDPQWKTLYHDTRHTVWSLRSEKDMRLQAEKFSSASTREERKKLWKEAGVGSSVLWLIPEFNPVEQIVVDPMHCLLNNACKFHVRDALGLEDEKAKKVKGRVAAFEWNWDPLEDSWSKSLKRTVKRAQKFLTWEIDDEEARDDVTDSDSADDEHTTDDERGDDDDKLWGNPKRGIQPVEVFTLTTLRERLSSSDISLEALEHIAGSLKLITVSARCTAPPGQQNSPKHSHSLIDRGTFEDLPGSGVYLELEPVPEFQIAPDYAIDLGEKVKGQRRTTPVKGDYIRAISYWVSRNLLNFTTKRRRSAHCSN